MFVLSMIKNFIKNNKNDFFSIINNSSLLNIRSLIDHSTRLVVIAIISSAVPSSLYVFGILLPLQYLFFSVSDFLKSVIFKILSLHSVFVLKPLLRFVILLHTLFALLFSFLLYLLNDQIYRFFHIPLSYSKGLELFWFGYISSQYLGSIASSMLSMLIALNKKHLSYFIIMIRSVCIIFFSYTLAHLYSIGIISFVFSSISTSILILCILYYFLRKLSRNPANTHDVSQIKLPKHIFLTNLPVICRHSIVFLGFMGSNYVFSYFGPELLSGTALALKIRQFCILPGIALGESVALTYLQNIKKSNFINLIRVGVFICCSTYIFLGITLYFCKNFLISLFTNSSSIIFYSNTYLDFFICSSAGFGCLIMLLSFLDIIGLTKYSLAFNTIFVSLLLVVGGGLSIFRNDIYYYYITSVVLSYSILILIYYLKNDFKENIRNRAYVH